MIRFDNRFIRELPGDAQQQNVVREVKGAAWSALAPTPCSAPRLIAASTPLAQELGLDIERLGKGEWLAALAGNGLIDGMQTWATCYGGHQFGNWAGQLGDGRAIFLGELLTADNRRYELQLKGAGKTPYARSADGRAVLRSSLREFLCSEAMHHLGVPTTRALSLVLSGDEVLRDMFYDGRPELEPGAIVCRVAPSFTRFGHFELPSSRGDLDLLRRLADFTIERDFAGAWSGGQRYAEWFAEVCRRSGVMIAHWMSKGFVHGVMNTDNMSILGLTIDYGPYGWLEEFDSGWTPNTTDAEGRRYCFGRQPLIGHWNLQQLGVALAPLIEDMEAIRAGLGAYETSLNFTLRCQYAAKLGLDDWRQVEDDALLHDLFDILGDAHLDMTDFFRRLADPPNDETAAQIASLRAASYDGAAFDASAMQLGEWLTRRQERLPEGPTPQQRRDAMNAVNPRYVLRNYLAQQAAENAAKGDFTLLHELLQTLQRPYEEQAGRDHLAALRPQWARHKPGSSMLSCSS